MEVLAPPHFEMNLAADIGKTGPKFEQKTGKVVDQRCLQASLRRIGT